MSPKNKNPYNPSTASGSGMSRASNTNLHVTKIRKTSAGSSQSTASRTYYSSDDQSSDDSSQPGPSQQPQIIITTTTNNEETSEEQLTSTRWIPQAAMTDVGDGPRASIAHLVRKCFRKGGSSSQSLTHRFIRYMVHELRSLKNEETDPVRIAHMDQMCFDFAEYYRDLITPKLDASTMTNVGERGELCFSNSCQVNKAFVELRDIDKSIQDLSSRKFDLYHKFITSHQHHRESPTSIIEELAMHAAQALIREENLPGPSRVTQVSVRQNFPFGPFIPLPPPPPPPVVYEAVQQQFFDNQVINAAAASVNFPSRVKLELKLNVGSPGDIFVNKICDFVAHFATMSGGILFTINTNGLLAIFKIKEFIPNSALHLVDTLEVYTDVVIELLFWNSFIIVGSKNGVITKYTVGCKIVKFLDLTEELTCMSENNGLLFAATSIGRIHIINLRSLTSVKDPVENGFHVMKIKSTSYSGSPLVVCLDACGLLYGLSIANGKIGSIVFKCKVPTLKIFDLSLGTNNMTIFCGATTYGMCLVLKDSAFTPTSLINVRPSALVCHNHLNFLGTDEGHLMIINIETQTSLVYHNISKETIVYIVFDPPDHIYFGTASGIYSILFYNMAEFFASSEST